MAFSAKDAADRAGTGDRVLGWKLDRAQRRELLHRFPPRYREVDADHVTLRIEAAPDSALPGETLGEIVGRADDGQGVEAMVVAIGGTTERPDGSVYHITWSLEPGRKAHESNAVLAAREWTPLDPPMPIRLEPGRWPRGA